MYNMKKQIHLHYATEKEARYYLRHLNYGFISTINRENTPILIENVPQLPRDTLNAIGTLRIFTMPYEQKQHKEINNFNPFIFNNPPPLVLTGGKERDQRRAITFSTKTSSGIFCKARTHPYQRPQRAINVNLGNCTMPSVTPPHLPQQPPRQIRQPASQMSFAPPPPVFQPLPELPSSTSRSNIENLVTIEDSNSLDSSSCSAPLGNFQSVNTTQELFYRQQNLELQNAFAQNQGSAFSGMEALKKNKERLKVHNDEPLIYNKKAKMQQVDAFLQRLHRHDNSVGPIDYIISDLPFDANTKQHVISYYQRTVSNDTPPVLLTFEYGASEPDILNRRNRKLSDRFYITSGQDKSKIYIDKNILSAENFFVIYYRAPPQGYLSNDKLTFNITNTVTKTDEIIQTNPHPEYVDFIDLNFNLDSNYTSTPTVQTNTYFRYLDAAPTQNYLEYVVDINYVTECIKEFYLFMEKVVANNGDILLSTPDSIVGQLNLPSSAGTIFENVENIVLSHLFEILKYDVHRNLGIASIQNSLIPAPLNVSKIIPDNPALFGKTSSQIGENIQTITTIFTCALLKYFEGQPSPYIELNCAIVPISITKENLLRTNGVLEYVEIIKRFPRGRFFDTMGTFRTNTFYADSSNFYFWEFAGNYVYVGNTVPAAVIQYDEDGEYLQQNEGEHPAKRPFPLNYILGRPVINVFLADITHPSKLYLALWAFIYIYKEQPAQVQVAAGEFWSTTQVFVYNEFMKNLTIVQSEEFQSIAQAVTKTNITSLV